MVFVNHYLNIQILSLKLNGRRVYTGFVPGLPSVCFIMSGWAKHVDQQKDKYNAKNNKNGCIDDFFHMKHYNSCF